MSVIDNSTRFVLVEKPLTFPHKDIVTGSPEGPLFDLSVDLHNYDGVVYVKVEHIEEMAHVLGMITKEEAEALYVRIAELEAESKKLPDEVEELVNGIAGLVSRYRSGSSSGSDVPSDLDADLSGENESGNSEGEQVIPAGDNETDAEFGGIFEGTSGQDNKPAGGKRPAKLSASAGNEFGISI